MARQPANKEEKQCEAAKYTKTQLIIAAHYRNKQDQIDALLDPGKMYTIAEADEVIEKYMKGEVE
ncbi:hypothetical protein H8S75_30975 [Hungatella sp. L12]|uniref:Phage protein n=1 Tax=Hungatella hominis TaxID=2763050 RepID=A0ABR7HGK5_9FIRM|nr:hypothetical protein [Hungatella hominis]MBC5712333.1 hypothetical protein [Hungatella hominis]